MVLSEYLKKLIEFWEKENNDSATRPTGVFELDFVQYIADELEAKDEHETELNALIKGGKNDT